MAYSDYGGRVFRNGERREDRCDAVLSPEGIKSTPGQWPGWTLPEGRDLGGYHVILGDGPIFVTLYKQSSITVFRLAEKVELEAIGSNVPADRFEEYDGKQYLNAPFGFVNDTEPTVFEIDGHRLEVRWTNEDNYYCYVRLTQPDGTVWTGWSGYGVGAGLEDGDHGYDSDERDAMLVEIFGSEAIAA